MVSWTNDKIIKFLQILGTEPCIWDPKHEEHKNRIAQVDAWRRIEVSLPFHASVEDLKKKKESIMAYYRSHVHKYKKSIKYGEKAYKTSWFAFDTLNSYLGPIYTGDTANRSESNISPFSLELVDESEEPGSPAARSSHHEDMELRRTIKRSRSIQSDYHTPEKRSRIVTENAENPLGEDFFYQAQATTSKTTQDYDEYDHFGLMIAAKIRKITDFEDRETIMNTIHNMVFQTLMKNKKKNASCC